MKLTCSCLNVIAKSEACLAHLLCARVSLEPVKLSID